MKQGSLFPGFACLLANAGALHTLFILFAYPDERQDDLLGLLLWWLFLALTYGVLALFLRRPRSLRSVVLMVLAGGLLQAGVSWTAGVRYPSLMAGLCLLLMWGGTYLRCYELSLKPPSAEGLITAFETTVLTLFAAALCVSGGVMETRALLPPAAGVLLTLGALAQQRSSNHRVQSAAFKNWAGRALLALLLAALTGIAVLFGALLTGSAAQILTQITTWFKEIGTAFFQLVDRFISWLIVLFPAQDFGELEVSGSAPLPTGGGEAYIPQLDVVPYLLAGVLLLGAVSVILWFLYKSGFSFRAPALVHRGTLTRKSRSPAKIISQLLLRLYRRFRFWIASLVRRNTGPGVLIWLERRLRRLHIRRGSGETCRAFLLRAQQVLPGCREMLTELADCLDQLYFGDGSDLTAQRAAQMRRCFRQTLGERETSDH